MTSFQAHMSVVQLHLVLRTEVVVLIVVGRHRETRSRLRGAWSSTLRCKRKRGIRVKQAC